MTDNRWIIKVTDDRRTTRVANIRVINSEYHENLGVFGKDRYKKPRAHASMLSRMVETAYISVAKRQRINKVTDIRRKRLPDNCEVMGVLIFL